MLKRFEVLNFKGFDKRLVFNLEARDYSFNNQIIKNKIVNKGIIYGKNGIGKSNLGIALFDIILHLTDKERIPSIYLNNYLNLDSNALYASFKYIFQFGNDEVIYEYNKKDQDYLLKETLIINDKVIVDYDYFDDSKKFIDKDFLGNLKIELSDNKLSILKYIYRNTPTKENHPFYKMMKFVENMLWYRGLSEGNAYSGFTNGGAWLSEEIYSQNKLKDFEKFLKENEVDLNLEFVSINNKHELMVNFGNDKKVSFYSVASTGTMALLLFFFWEINSFNKISFLFIDEFDAFFHYEAARNIVMILNKNTSFQSLITTHNTYLMQNALTRPDSCFIMSKNKITSLSESTLKEIREAHNLEKMYVNGAFNE